MANLRDERSVGGLDSMKLVVVLRRIVSAPRRNFREPLPGEAVVTRFTHTDLLLLRPQLLSGIEQASVLELNGTVRAIDGRRHTRGPVSASIGRANESLNVISTKFNDDWIAPIGQITSLKKLSFTNNGKLTDAGMEKLAGLTNLESFNFVGTQITGRAYAKCTNWSKVTRVSHRGSSIDDEGIKELCDHLPNLESISLAHAKFTDAGAPNLAKLKKLKGLELGAHATSAALQNLIGLPLEYLQLGEGFSGTDSIMAIKPISTLKRVTLTDCKKLDDAGLKAAADLKQLEQLELGSLELPDERLPQLQAFAFLKELKLIRRPQGYPPETQAKIKALLPKVDVKFQ